MSEIALLQFGHILCLVYWLGADMGVFYSSYFLVDEKLSVETRLSFAKLLFALDQSPRICMPLILAFGVHLAWRLGMWAVPGALVAGVWAVCLGWLAMVIVLHLRGHAAQKLASFDYGFRLVVIATLVGYAIYAITAGQLATWLSAKLLIFAALVGCGLLIRRGLRPFGPAFAALAQNRATDADNAAIRQSLASTRPFVVCIWIGLLVNTALGVHLIVF